MHIPKRRKEKNAPLIKKTSEMLKTVAHGMELGKNGMSKGRSAGRK